MMQCPICKNILHEYKNENNTKSLRCIMNHSFDVSKYNYVNLLVSKNGSGDNKEMIKSRHEFLKNDYYMPLALKIKEKVDKYPIENILDLGCGEGYFDRIIGKDIYGLDISKDAIMIASKAKKEDTIKYVVASSFKIPFIDKYFDCLLSIFAPLDAKDASRVCKKYLIKVIPGKNHLLELKEALYENVRETSVLKEDIDGFKLIDEDNLTYKMNVKNVNELFKMTPYFYTTHGNYDITLNQMDITFDFIIRLYEVL